MSWCVPVADHCEKRPLDLNFTRVLGLYGFDVIGPASFQRQYWSEVLEILRDRIKADVIVTSVPATGSIQDRAKVLDEKLRGLAKGKEVNFFGHSMGGLDCRHLITHIRPKEYTPLSLTTIATPHRGSPFMDWCNVSSSARFLILILLIFARILA